MVAKRKLARSGQCRIIAGKWRGRIIHFNDAEGLRPTTDRIRETVFNWLQPYLAGSNCLDLFAGSGALGFEAMSRGAGQLTLVEKNQQSVEKLNDTVVSLGAESIKIYHDDALKWLQSLAKIKQYNIIFLDPPFKQAILLPCCHALNESGVLAEDAIIYVEQPAEQASLVESQLPSDWSCFREKQAGQVKYQLFERLI